MNEEICEHGHYAGQCAACDTVVDLRARLAEAEKRQDELRQRASVVSREAHALARERDDFARDVIRLEKQRDALEADYELAAPNVRKLIAENETLRALVEKAKEYAAHKDDCPKGFVVFQKGSGFKEASCNCGYDEWKERIRE